MKLKAPFCFPPSEKSDSELCSPFWRTKSNLSLIRAEISWLSYTRINWKSGLRYVFLAGLKNQKLCKRAFENISDLFAQVVLHCFFFKKSIPVSSNLCGGISWLYLRRFVFSKYNKNLNFSSRKQKIVSKTCVSLIFFQNFIVWHSTSLYVSDAAPFFNFWKDHIRFAIGACLNFMNLSYPNQLLRLFCKSRYSLKQRVKLQKKC